LRDEIENLVGNNLMMNRKIENEVKLEDEKKHLERDK
jgi:hypothetical protein